MTAVLRRLRVIVKRHLARVVLVIEFCDDCGVAQPLIWTAADGLWATVTEQPLATDMGGVLCPPCFDRRARGQGRLLRWVPREMGR
jgi:hypothetical protein